MPRLHLVAFLAVASLAAAHPACGQASTDDPAQVVLGRLLTQARETGALERVLGEHFYRYDMIERGGQGQAGEADPKLIVTFSGEQDVAQEQVTWAFALVNADLRLSMTYTYGFDGRLRTARIRMGEGPEGIDASGEVSGGLLRLGIAQGEGIKTAEIPWDDDALPELVAMMVLPILADQGLPPTLRFKPFEGEDLKLREGKTQTLARDPEPAESPWGPAERFTIGEGSQVHTVLVSTDEAQRGRLVQVEMDGRKRMAWISPEDGAAWLDRFGAE